MKILEKGRDQKGWAIEAKCTGTGNGGGGCGSKLLVEQADVFVTRRSARDEITTYNTFRCPACRVLTDLSGVLPFRAGEDPEKAKNSER